MSINQASSQSSVKHFPINIAITAAFDYALAVCCLAPYWMTSVCVDWEEWFESDDKASPQQPFFNPQGKSIIQ